MLVEEFDVSRGPSSILGYQCQKQCCQLIFCPLMSILFCSLLAGNARNSPGTTNFMVGSNQTGFHCYRIDIGYHQIEFYRTIMVSASIILFTIVSNSALGTIELSTIASLWYWHLSNWFYCYPIGIGYHQIKYHRIIMNRHWVLSKFLAIKYHMLSFG